MVVDRGGVLSGWDVARGGSSEVKGERIKVEKVNVRLLLDRLASTQAESAAVSTVGLLNNGSGGLYHGWEISKRRSRSR